MKRVRNLGMIVLAACFGCAADGGPVGSGISGSSASITGNVINVETTTSTTAVNARVAFAVLSVADNNSVPRVRISIDEVPGSQTTTDAEGNFELRGNFSGALTLRFAVSGLELTKPVDVPSGGTIVLQDIELLPGGVQAQAARQLGFFGHVDFIDCTDGTLLMHDDRRQSMQFMVTLMSETSIVEHGGKAASCEDIRPGDSVEVDGLIAPADGTIAALNVTIAPPGPPREPPPVRPVSLFGDITAIDCEAGFLIVDDSAHRSRLRLSPDTVIMRPDRTRLLCRDLALGDHVQGMGRLTLAMPGMIDATNLIVTPASQPGVLRFFGFVSAIDCGAGLLQLTDVNTTVSVGLLPTTLIIRDNDQPGACTDIRIGDRVQGSGAISDRPDVIDAITLRLGTHGPPGGPHGMHAPAADRQMRAPGQLESGRVC